MRQVKNKLSYHRVLRALLLGTCIALAGCSANPGAAIGTLDQPFQALTLAHLPAVGTLVLERGDENALTELGLGGPSPLNQPPALPYNQNGLYWSEQFSLVAGDELTVIANSGTALSWFGADWADRDIRGVLALTNIDEDGWNFMAIYPASANAEDGHNSHRLTLHYTIREGGDYQIIIKNANPAQPQNLSLAVTVAGPRTAAPPDSVPD